MYNEELEIEREIIGLIDACVLSSILNPKKPGDVIKKYKHRFPLIDKMKARHFNHVWVVKKYFK